MRPAVGLLLFYKEKSEENENMKNYKIAVAGTGYVGLSLSVLLAQHNQVMAVDIVQAKVDMINNHKWFFYLLGSVLLVTAMLSFLLQQSQGMEALQMLIGGFVIFMIPQVVGSVIVLLELAAVMLRQAWYI